MMRIEIRISKKDPLCLKQPCIFLSNKKRISLTAFFYLSCIRNIFLGTLDTSAFSADFITNLNFAHILTSKNSRQSNRGQIPSLKDFFYIPFLH